MSRETPNSAARQAPKALRKYLLAHAEPEAEFATEIGARFGDVLVVPACGEHESLTSTLASLPASSRGPVAIIVVVNARGDAPQCVHTANHRAMTQLREIYGAGRSLAANAVVMDHPCGSLVLIDRASAGLFLPERQGVGLARKIGADFALRLASEGRLRSPWIHCTDADALLPADYFERSIEVDGDAATCDAALLFPFRHVAMSGLATERASDAALEYEASLRYYVLGLRHAASPYAFHTIGSTIAIRSSRYAEVRGFPRRAAGEDFYLLNKLRKLGTVRTLGGDPIQLSDRLSDRVPFGTGAALLRAKQSGEGRTTVAPEVFAVLRTWLQCLEALALDPRFDLDSALDAQSGPLDASTLRSILTERGLLERARSASSARDEAQRRLRLRVSFDAFETLKLLHAIRDRALPPIPLREAVAHAPFLSLAGHEDLQDICERLAAAERS